VGADRPVPGGRETGACLVSHPNVNQVAFTGSTVGDHQVGEVCGRLLRPITLELGGKSAVIILDDVQLDLPSIRSKLLLNTLANNGQTCFLFARIIAPRSRRRIGISLVTLQLHRSKVMQKIAAKSFAELVGIARQLRVPPTSLPMYNAQPATEQLHVR
jgi:acyl-CoA reductase-like NAD-dependent aldehyde dehydrogenase